MDFAAEVSKIINNDENLFIKNYFELQKRSEDKYGENTLVFAEVGSFYEIYETEEIGKASEIAKTLNILLTKKNKKISQVSVSNPRLCGIPSVSLEKHLEKLSLENKWTIILISQEGRPPKIKRVLDKIISPGTNIDYIEDDEKKYIASVYIERNIKGIYSAGMTLLDPTLGEVLVYENYGKKNDKEMILDEVKQIIATHNIKEIINITNERGLLEGKNIVYQDIENVSINYQEQLVKHSFSVDTTYLSAIELIDMEKMPFALNSLTSLLDFVIEHNRLIGVSLKKPKQIYSSKYMYLGNNPISQLDILKKEDIDLVDIVNRGITAIGRRFIKEQLMNPLKDRVSIEKRLRDSAGFIGYEHRELIENNLKGIYDIERIIRKCQIKTVQPFELYNLHKSLNLIKEIEEVRGVQDDKLGLFVKSLEDKFDLEILSLSNMSNIDRTFVRKGVSHQIDDLQFELNEIQKNTDLGLGDGYILKQTESEGLYYEITNRKYEELGHRLESYEVETVKKLRNSKKVFIRELSDLYNQKVVVLDKLVKLTKEVFFNEVARIEVDMIREKIDFLCDVEFCINNAKLYEERAYTIPEILDSVENIYEVEELRHPIVEALERDIFIPNSIQFGKRTEMLLDTDVCFNDEKVNGYLLYGQNSSGKTVLSKSVGLSIVMAQAGFFVPAKKLRMSVYDSIFTRVSGNDDLRRGLSTFAVEMLELKNILNRANSKSMVIGDEISHGTETVSGLSIVASTILSLKEKNSSFIIATHLHQLDIIDEIKEAKEISQIHLSLNYLESEDKLIYNRKIQKGKGSSVYGLEFAKSLKLPTEFITKAYKIRKEIASDLSGLEELTKKRQSRYNSSVFVGVCSKCGGKAEDIHHILGQHKADERGMVGHIRINHKSNLTPLCKKCHREEHMSLIEYNPTGDERDLE